MLAQLARDKGVQSMVGDAIAESSDNSFLAKMARNPKGAREDNAARMRQIGMHLAHCVYHDVAAVCSAREDRL
jgi:hypothetical protein